MTGTCPTDGKPQALHVLVEHVHGSMIDADSAFAIQWNIDPVDGEVVLDLYGVGSIKSDMRQQECILIGDQRIHTADTVKPQVPHTCKTSFKGLVVSIDVSGPRMKVSVHKFLSTSRITLNPMANAIPIGMQLQRDPVANGLTIDPG
ncbi:MAG: hypothetical protein ACK56F_16315, partial [bacterium]